MKLSPGLQLVWNVAGQEAQAAKMAEIRPEHFLCALLKYVELSDDDLGRVAAQPIVAVMLVDERGRLQARVTAEKIDSTRVRRRLRDELGEGKTSPGDGVMHRSDASRKLFEQAAVLAEKEMGVIETLHMLTVILQAPTPAMVKVMGKGRVAAPASATGEPQTELRQRYTRPLTSPAAPPSPELSSAQQRVLARALEPGRKDWLLLICEPQVHPAALIAQAVINGVGAVDVLSLDLAALVGPPGAPLKVVDTLSDLLLELSGPDQPWLLIQLAEPQTIRKADQAAGDSALLGPIIETLRSLPPDVTPRIVLAVSETVFHEQIETNPALDRLFRPIWLHVLDPDWAPREL